MAFTAIISSAVIYPLSIRLVKKVFRLKSYFNVHFVTVYDKQGCNSHNSKLERVCHRSESGLLQLLLSGKELPHKARLANEIAVKFTMIGLITLLFLFSIFVNGDLIADDHQYIMITILIN